MCPTPKNILQSKSQGNNNNIPVYICCLGLALNPDGSPPDSYSSGLKIGRIAWFENGSFCRASASCRGRAADSSGAFHPQQQLSLVEAAYVFLIVMILAVVNDLRCSTYLILRTDY